MDSSQAGRALGRLGRGIKKTMSKAALQQRKDAGKASAKARIQKACHESCFVENKVN